MGNWTVAPAIVASGGTIFVSARSSVEGGRNLWNGVAAPAITGVATVYLDPNSTIRTPTGI